MSFRLRTGVFAYSFDFRVATERDPGQIAGQARRQIRGETRDLLVRITPGEMQIERAEGTRVVVRAPPLRSPA